MGWCFVVVSVSRRSVRGCGPWDFVKRGDGIVVTNFRDLLCWLGRYVGGGWYGRLGSEFHAFDAFLRQGPVGFGGFFVLDRWLDGCLRWRDAVVWNSIGEVAGSTCRDGLARFVCLAKKACYEVLLVSR